MAKIPEFNLESRNRTQRDLEFILRNMNEIQPADVGNIASDHSINILVYAQKIQEKYLPNALYSNETENLVKKALSLAREFAYLGQIYQNYDKEKIPEDIQEMESINATLDEQKNDFGLDRTEQKEKYAQLFKWKKRFLIELEHHMNKIKPHINKLFTELRQDIMKHYNTALMEIGYSLS